MTPFTNPRQHAAAGLYWVHRELDQNLLLARQLIEQYAENSAEPAPLHRAMAQLVEVRGLCTVIQLYGVVLLASELQQTLEDLGANRIPDRHPALSAAVSACVQLSDYLDSLSAGQDDCALLLQPAINELRLARGRSLLTEEDLFVAQFGALQRSLPLPAPKPQLLTAQAEAKRLLPMFSAALLSWFKDQDTGPSLSRIGRIAELLADSSRSAPLHQLWRIAAACVEALLSRTQDESLELKRQFGRAGQLLRLVGEIGEDAAVSHMSDVSQRLLFHAGRSRGTGPRITSLRRLLELDVWLPSPENVQQGRARLRGPNTALLSKVAEEVRSDLAEVKDSIDVALRTGGEAVEFEATSQRLKRVGDTLMMLGLTHESRTLAQPLETLQEAGQAQPATPEAWMEFATAVLRVEQSLDGALYDQLRSLPGATAAAPSPGPTADLRDGTGAVLRESLVNVARIKTHVEAFVKNGDGFGLPDTARLLDEIGSAFRILGRTRADGLVTGIRQYLNSPAFDEVRQHRVRAERFADCIAALEYYIEMRRDSQPGADDLLDHLDDLVIRLHEPLPAESELPLELQPQESSSLRIDDVMPVEAEAAPAAAQAEPPASEPELLGELELPAIGKPELTLDVPVLELPELEPADLTPAAAATPPVSTPTLDLDLELAADEPAPAMAASPAVATPAAQDEELDAEIREVFLAEAGEVLELLQRTVPRWLRQPQERELLVEIRRAFHTLKGSGRMVGAQDVGEFSWALETLLNRCLDRTIDLSQAAIETVRDGVGLLPALIEAFRGRHAANPSAAALAETARRIAAGSAAGDSADLIAVFRSDATERLGMIARWINEQSPLATDHDVPESVVRAFHTLRGAALAVGARAVGELSGSLETYLGALQQSRQPLGAAGLRLVGDSVGAMGDWVANLGEASQSPADVQPWLARLEAVRAGTGDSGSVEDEEDRQLAEVFSFEALDLVQRFESELELWSRTPSAMQHARAMRTTVHTLKGAAGMAQCAPIAGVAQALNLRLAMMAEGSAPKPGFFAALKGIVDGLYGLLDQFREGSLEGDGGEWIARVMSLDPASDAAPAPSVAPQIEALDPEVLEIFLLEGEELMEEIETQAAAVSENPDDAVALGAWNRSLHTLKGSARLAGLSGLADVTHRLETDTNVAMLEGHRAHPLFKVRLRIAVDGLHRLLDEARAGRAGDASDILRAIDAARVEAAPAVPTPAIAPAEPAAKASGEAGASGDSDDELDLAAGLALAAQELDELALLGPLDAAPAAAAQAEELIELSGDLPSGEITDQPAESPAPPATEPAAPEAAKTIAYDAELAAIFASESAELLDTLQETLTAWRLDSAAVDPPREMQRALHTLKGGARIAGLNRMGSAAHALETQVALIEQGRAAADAEGLQRIATQIDALLQMQDKLERGDALQLTGAEQEAPVVADIALPLDLEEAAAQAETQVPAGSNGWDPQLFWRPESDDAVTAAMRRENARVPVDRLDAMLNQAGEISIYRSRLEENHTSLSSSINEMAQTVARVREQLRLLDIETEAQIAARGFSRGSEDPGHRYDSQFDALEMDRYSRMQELSRTLAESLSDLGSLHASLDTAASEAETLLQQQGRINNELQQSLMGTLMVPFSRQVQRLGRVVRQTAEQNGKRARAEFGGADSELDRNVLERMTAPLEHLLRNSVVHGIERPDIRLAAGKPAEGLVEVNLKREGSQLLIEVRDDGSGLDFGAIRAQAIRRGLMRAEAQVSEDDLARFIFAPGFSTATKLTQDAGRGIGMDVVASEVKQLGGTLDISSEAGLGTRFRIRLPLMLAVAQALTVQTGEELFAIPLAAVEGIARAPREAVTAMLRDGVTPLQYGGHDYRVLRLGDLVGLPAPLRIESRTVPAILIRLGDGLGGSERRVAVVVDRLIGNREIVSKAAGPILGSVAGVTGATILADGRVMLILDIPALILEATRRQLSAEAAALTSNVAEEIRPLVMVVDDSITIRRVSERLLTRNGYRVITAKDGLDAMAMLQTEAPAAILLDIEMPRADGFEVAAFVRNTARIASTPIVMITSRSGDKHREHARNLGVDRYLIKPYQEDKLLAELRTLIAPQKVSA